MKKVFGMKPEEVVQKVKDSGVRGRGGAGFPTGLKMEFHVQKGPANQVILLQTQMNQNLEHVRTEN